MLKYTLFLLSISLVSYANVINYDTSSLNDELQTSVNEVIDDLMDKTCLFFRISDQEPQVTFLESTHCAWQKDNNTVHLSTNCAKEEVVYELIGRVLGVEQPRAHVVRHLNLHYNCTEKCTLECLHGGEVLDDCSCKCGYGFSGEKCEKLTKETIFTDKACGVIDAEDRGQISLSTFPMTRPKNTFCQWLIKSNDPWTVIDAEIEELGLDNHDINPGMKCNDHLTIYGAHGINGPIPCDNSVNITKLHSTHNWLLLELRTNPYSEDSFKGPSIRYSTRKVQPGVRIYSEGMSASASLFFSSSLALVISYLFC